MAEGKVAGYMTPESRAWLEEVFSDRLGLAVSLREIEGGTALRVMNSEVNVRFPYHGTMFVRQDSALPCAVFDARREGWNPVVHDPIPAPGMSSLVSPLVAMVDGECRIDYDLPGMMFWHLARVEEIDRADLDAHGRFPATSSHALKYGYLHRPIVDEWLEILRQVIEHHWPGSLIRRSTFSMAVSHDVDLPGRYSLCTPLTWGRRIASAIISRGAVVEAVNALRTPLGLGSRVAESDPFNTFDWLMDRSEERGLSSMFYFMVGKTHSKFDPGYDPRHPAIRSLIRRALDRGHGVGLHPSYDTLDDVEALRREVECLRSVISEETGKECVFGARAHYLRWRHPDTLRAFSEVGLVHDATLGFADSAGFRCGTSSAYMAFDPVRQVKLPILIKPLVAMEGSVITYMRKGSGDAAIEAFLELKNACRRVGGCFSLLWHNSELHAPNLKSTYIAVLDG